MSAAISRPPSATGSANHIARALLLDEPLSIDAHELTDKGTINQRAVLTHRAHLVDELYTPPYSPRALLAAAGGSASKPAETGP